jgi:hypothetical protein
MQNRSAFPTPRHQHDPRVHDQPAPDLQGKVGLVSTIKCFDDEGEGGKAEERMLGFRKNERRCAIAFHAAKEALHLVAFHIELLA